MQKIGRFTPTGRKLLGPGADLVELDADNGLRHTAVVFHPQYRTHRAINEALDVVRGFLEAPLVAGLVELVEHDRAQGAFVYPTGQSWSVAEVIRSLADMGESGGLRAGLELMYAAGQILAEAAEIGAMSGVYSHGGLTPWRVLLKQDGQVMIIGEGLPQVEILVFAEDQTQIPREDSFRYCPPERIEFEPENLSSDLFGLALVAFELMTGKPVYDGLVDDIRQQAARGEGSRRLFKVRDQIPDGVRGLLTTALRPNPQDRHATGGAFLEEVRKLLSSAEARGPSLMEVMEKVAAQGKRVGKALEGGKTQAISADARAKLLAELDEEDEGPRSPPPRAQGWAPADRAGRAAPSPTSTATPPAQPATPPPTARPVPVPPEPTAEAPRWGPVPRARPVRRAGSELPEGPGEPTPPPEPAALTPPAGNRLADQLLARMRAEEGAAAEPSGEGAFTPGRVRRAPPRREGVEGLPPTGAGKPPEPPPPPEAGRVGPASRVGPPPARTPPPPEPAPPPVTPVSPPPVTPVTPVSPPPVTPVTPVSPPPVTPVTPVAVRNTPPPPPTSSLSEEIGVVISEPEAAPPRTGGPVPAVLRPQVPAEAGRVAGASSFASAELARAPESLLSGRKGTAELYTFQREPGGRALRVRLSVKATVAEAVSFLVGYVFPVRADLTGQLAGWYRLEQEGRLVPPGAFLETLDPGRPLALRFVPNQVVFADLEVVGAPAPVRFVAPVGTAVPAATLVDHLVAWLALPEGRWRLVREGRVLDSHAILADEEVGALLRLQLRVVPGDEAEAG